MDQLPGLPPTAFTKADPSPDPAFYRQPRFVTHIDDGAIATVTHSTATPCPRAAPCSTS